MNDLIHYKHGHLCKPNGVGDYTFYCPKNGDKAGFITFMHRSLLSGFCDCGLPIDMDEQPKSANMHGILSPCPQCGSLETHGIITEHYQKTRIGTIFSYTRIAECLCCGHSSGHVPGIPPYVFSDQERADIESAWSGK